ncbi:MAG: ABC transporter ATP-binding protein [Candidatus Methanomethylophilaceae archaeon]|nr:ABC transporter ATP-binding protein [Candidatus Methanomethylophilaceae archaeon]
MGDAPAIEAVGLSKRYGSFSAISDVGLEVGKGEFMGLLGPNGSGKSTTLKAITGLIVPDSGRVWINGIDIQDHRRAMERVGCVIETPEPYPNFTPAETLDYVGRLYGMDSYEIAIRARDVLESVRMWDWRDKRIGSFSKGMRQRIVIAQALMPNPETLILDEPTSGLDARGMIEVRLLLSELRQRGRSLLVSTHILKEVSEICGSVTMIRKGRVVRSGKVSELVKGLSDTSVVLEVETMRPLTRELVYDIDALEGVSGTKMLSPTRVRMIFDGTTEQQCRLTDMVYGSGLGVRHINEQGPDLEALYMDVTMAEDIL